VVLGTLFAAMAFHATAALAESPSALLEKAIYTEETVGDLDAATKLYQQTVAEAKTVDAIAAKAQYRLGLCLLKQGKKEQGLAALQELVRRFPDQKELVAKAKDRIPAKAGLKLQPVAWREGESLNYRILLGGGLELGTVIYSVEPATLDGQKIWRFRSRTYAAGRQLASRVDAHLDTLLPINSSWTIAGVGETRCQYERGKVIVKTGAAGAETTRTIEIDPTPYDNEEGVFVFRCLPMTDKFQTKVPIFSSIGAGGMVIGFEVQGRETVKVPAGKFSCFKVLLPTPINQTFWLSDDEHHYPVKIEANGVLMPLTKIETFKPGEIRKYADAELALALPPSWNVYRTEGVHVLLAPNANWDILIKTTKLEKLSAEEKQSPRAWAEKGLPDAAKQLKDLKVRAASWETTTIAGRPAVSFLGDYVATNGRPMAQYTVCVFGKTTAFKMNGDCPRDGVDDMKKAVRPVIESLEVQ